MKKEVQNKATAGVLERIKKIEKKVRSRAVSGNRRKRRILLSLVKKLSVARRFLSKRENYQCMKSVKTAIEVILKIMEILRMIKS